jgi:hypothetical protein
MADIGHVYACRAKGLGEIIETQNDRNHGVARGTVAGVLASLLSFTAQPASAKPNETPKAFVHRVYANYETSDNSTGVARTRPEGSAYYASSLLDALVKDQALLQQKEGVVDSDPLCDCQAWENLRVEGLALSKGDAGTVKARVVIGNFVGAQRVETVVVLTLSRTPAGWRIADVGNRDRPSLLAALRNEINDLEQASRPGGGARKPAP